MRILHVLSQFALTGAEVYATTLANQQIEEGNEVFIVSPFWHTEVNAEVISLPLGYASIFKRIKSIFLLRRLIKKMDIDIIHAHSRASSWVCHFAIMGLPIPFISTVHGRQHKHKHKKSLDIYGEKVITVCENIATHLSEEMGIPASKLTVIPNGIDFPALSANIKPALPPWEGITIAIPGRTTGPKGDRTGLIISKIMPKLLATNTRLRIVIVGGELTDLQPEYQNAWEQLFTNFPKRCIWVGFVPNLKDYLNDSDIVIGSGRVAIEAIAAGKVTIAFGESCYEGIVTHSNYSHALASNFGDISARLPLPEVDWAKIEDDLLFAQSQVLDPWVKQHVLSHFNLANIALKVADVYASAFMKQRFPRHIPILMYHKVPDAMLDSPHRIFVPKEQFAKQMAFLHKNGFQSITFQEYELFRKGVMHYSMFPKKPIVLTFDDGYTNNLTNALPIMQKYGFKGVVFLLGNNTHKHNFWDEDGASAPLLNAEDRKQLAHAGWEMAAHGLSHCNLTECSEEQAIQELSHSKEMLEKEFDRKVISFAYPYGKANTEIKELAQEAGYKYAVVIDENAGLHWEDDRLGLFRAYIFPEDAEPQLKKKSAWWYRKYFKLKRGK